MTHILKLLPLLAVFFTTGFGTQSSEFIVKGVSGNDVLLDRIWDRGCIPVSAATTGPRPIGRSRAWNS